MSKKTTATKTKTPVSRPVKQPKPRRKPKPAAKPGIADTEFAKDMKAIHEDRGQIAECSKAEQPDRPVENPESKLRRVVQSFLFEERDCEHSGSTSELMRDACDLIEMLKLRIVGLEGHIEEVQNLAQILDQRAEAFMQLYEDIVLAGRGRKRRGMTRLEEVCRAYDDWSRKEQSRSEREQIDIRKIVGGPDFNLFDHRNHPSGCQREPSPFNGIARPVFF